MTHAPPSLADFWLGDQFCSLAFSLASLWTLGCSIHNDWRLGSSQKCGVTHHWRGPLLLSCLPSFIRFLQCMKRYTDSRLGVHMINVRFITQSLTCSSDVRTHRAENIYRVCCTIFSIISGGTMARKLETNSSYCFASVDRSCRFTHRLGYSHCFYLSIVQVPEARCCPPRTCSWIGPFFIRRRSTSSFIPSSCTRTIFWCAKIRLSHSGLLTFRHTGLLFCNCGH